MKSYASIPAATEINILTILDIYRYNLSVAKICGKIIITQSHRAAKIEFWRGSKERMEFIESIIEKLNNTSWLRGFV